MKKHILSAIAVACLTTATCAYAQPTNDSQRVLTSKKITKSLTEYTYFGKIEFGTESALTALANMNTRSRQCSPENFIGDVVTFRLVSAGDTKFNFILAKSLSTLIDPQQPVTITLYQKTNFSLGNPQAVPSVTIEQNNLKLTAFVPEGFAFQ